MTTAHTGTGIAIIGIGCRFPGHANSPRQFWHNLIRGVDAISEISKERFDVDRFYTREGLEPGTLRTRWAGLADFVDGFDARFFGISPREAARMDPQQRILLELVWDALQDGGEIPAQLAGAKIGVFAGSSGHDYGDLQVNPANERLIDGHTLSGTASSIIANRISYFFDFQGPSLAVDTACSSSLTAVHLACQSMAAGECDMAVAGGVNLLLTPQAFMAMNMAAMLSPDGRCKTFDARANGFVRGEGAGIVILKPLDRALQDGNPVYAVIRGTAANQDGRTASMTQPNAEAQEAMLRKVLADAGVDARDVQYVEAHGTGTATGDPVEALALGRVLRDGRSSDQRCLIGSVKANIGHLEAAAGIAGLIKAALVLKHRQIPPHLHFHEPNPAIPFDDLCLRVPVSLQPWPPAARPTFAGVNSFGFGGSNAHALLEGPPEVEAPARRRSRAHLLVVSARNPNALAEAAREFSSFLEEADPADLPAICYTAAARRTRHDFRLAAVGDSQQTLAAELQAFANGDAGSRCVPVECSRKSQPKVAFVFSGMGSQEKGIARHLLHNEPVFHAVIEQCGEVLRPLAGWSLLDVFEGHSWSPNIEDANVAQVANFALQAGLVALWSSWGIEPDAVIGHSTGEIAAAYASGALTLADALRLAYHRGRLLHRISGRGRMLAAGVPKVEAERYVSGRESRIAIAAHNSPSSVTFSGDSEILDQIAAELQQTGVFSRFVPVAVPYHSPQIDPLREELLAALADLQPRPARIPVASATLADWATNGYAGTQYWWRNIREPVRFAAAADLLIEDGYEIFLEVGAHPVLRSALSECLEARQKHGTVLASLRRGEDDCVTARQTLGMLHSLGCQVNWAEALGSRQVLAGLPLYPWQRERHWLGPEFQTGSASQQAGGSETGHPLLGIRLRSARQCWETDLQDRRLAYLRGHVVQGTPVFPAAAYLEMMRAAAELSSAEGGQSIHEVAFHKMLPVAEGAEPLIQLVCDADGTFTVYSAADRAQGMWTAHATGKIGKSAPTAGPTAVLADIRARCLKKVSISDWYRLFQERGLDYSGAFRGVQELWQGKGEALGMVRILEEFESSTLSYGIHPALLDSALQVTGAALASAQGMMPHATLLPASVERLECYAAAGTGFWSHVSVRSAGLDFVETDVRAFDDNGNSVFSLIGLRCVLLGAKATTVIADPDSLYQYQWELATQLEPLKGIRIDKVARPPGASVYEVEPRLDALAGGLIRETMARLECDWRAADPRNYASVALSHGVIESQQKFFGRLLQLLNESEIAREDSCDPADFAAAHPEWSDVAFLLSWCGNAWADVLTGKRQPQEVLFAPEALEWLAGFYKTNPAFQPLHQTIAGIISRVCASHSAKSPICILEIGAGTGGATSAILPKLPADKTDYCFTDISPFFLSRARTQFAAFPNVSYALFDVQANSGLPDLPHTQFDVILAFDVIHAAGDPAAALRNVCRMLRPNGLFILMEVLRSPIWTDGIFGMFQGWWRTSGDPLPVHSLRTRNEWLHALKEAGFAESVSVDSTEPEDQATQAVLLARQSSENLAAGAIPGLQWMILKDQRGIGARIAESLRRAGHSCTTVEQGTSWNSAEIQRADRILHLWSLDALPSEFMSADELMRAQQSGSHSLLSLVQTIAAAEGASPQLWIVTSGAQCLPGDRGDLNITHSTLWGMGRVVVNEQPSLRCRLADLGAMPGPSEIENLVRELLDDSEEEELKFRGPDRFVKRLRKSPPGTAPPETKRSVSPEETTIGLRVGTPGALGTLALREIAPLRPGPGELLLRVKAAGLNFRDIMVASGLIPPPPSTTRWGTATFGYECAGVVLAVGEGVDSFRPGDEVVSAATAALASHTLVYAAMTVPKPPSISFNNAAGILTVFVTAHYALNYVTRIQAGERILIHAGAGGVGRHSSLPAPGCRNLHHRGNRGKARLFEVPGSSACDGFALSRFRR
jgi:acyl transferase domain-containing protein